MAAASSPRWSPPRRPSCLSSRRCRSQRRAACTAACRPKRCSALRSASGPAPSPPSWSATPRRPARRTAPPTRRGLPPCSSSLSAPRRRPSRCRRCAVCGRSRAPRRARGHATPSARRSCCSTQRRETRSPCMRCSPSAASAAAARRRRRGSCAAACFSRCSPSLATPLRRSRLARRRPAPSALCCAAEAAAAAARRRPRRRPACWST
mmetsp:Transcript_8681/g.27297  ORF Transcript_8681/g.27297 Transcript_8681/m.27297 type:complete len:208 (+) Transcript_8681:1567-2190(+)